MNNLQHSDKLKTYILSIICSDDKYLTKTETKGKLAYLKAAFEVEGFYGADRHNQYETLLERWMQGLPSNFNVEYINLEIERKGKDLGLLPLNASDEEVYEFVRNWFNLLAKAVLCLFEEYNVN